MSSVARSWEVEGGGNAASSLYPLPPTRWVCFALLLLFLAGCTADISTSGTAGQTESAGSDFGFELTRDWRGLAIMITLLSGLLVALAYMFGQSFEMPELKAWASIELVQIAATLIIILSFAAVFTLLDSSIALVVNESDLGFTCNVLENCAVSTATHYLQGLEDMARGEVADVADKALLAGQMQSYRLGVGSSQAFWPPLLQSYFSFSASHSWARYAMDLELQTQLIQWQGNILSVIASQKFFVEAIAFKMAPVILLIGIVARSFFVTRRAGGLLMAIGLGVMFVFPAMYVVNWISLNITLFGDEVITPPTGLQCPSACRENPPQFFLQGGERVANERALRERLMVEEEDETADNNIALLATGQVPALGVNGQTVNSCEFFARTPWGYCPTLCRTMPLPLGEECTFYNDTRNLEPDVQETCDALPGNLRNSMEECDETLDPPVDIKKACYLLPEPCRLVREVEAPNVELENQCPPGCRTTLPLKPVCGNACLEARDYCRVAQKEGLTNPVLVPISVLVDAGELPDECDAAVACPASLDAYESCVYVQPSEAMRDQCGGCVFVGKEYTVEPPVYSDCQRLCGASGPGQLSPAEFAQATRGQMYGRPEVTGVSALIIPAYILPLLNVVVTLMFIRTFSPIFGGDVEIPGVAKLL